MPFTFAHPAAVLPFAKKHSKHISVTALILGSMASDFEYFYTLDRMVLLAINGSGSYI